MKRNRYQEGSLRLYERAKGDRAWEYRWYETQPDGTRRRRSSFIGTMKNSRLKRLPRKLLPRLEQTSTQKPLAQNWKR